MGVAQGQMLARSLRMMNGVLHVKRDGVTGGHTHSNDGDTQSKNARQSHPGTIPLNTGLRAMRCPAAAHFVLKLKPVIPHTLAAVCAQYHPTTCVACTHIFGGNNTNDAEVIVLNVDFES